MLLLFSVRLGAGREKLERPRIQNFMNKSALAVMIPSLFMFANARADLQNLIVNGGFTAGLAGWSATPNVSVVNSYDALGPVVNPSVTPPGLPFFAVMSPSGADDSALGQNPSVPSDFRRPAVLSFEFDLVGLDTATLQRNEEQGPTLSLSIGGDPVFSETYADAGGPTLKTKGASGQTGWQTVTMDLTTAEVQDIRANGVQFAFVVDQADSENFDFAAAIDNVALIATVPDSSSTVLLLGGILAGIGFAKRRMRA